MAGSDQVGSNEPSVRVVRHRVGVADDGARGEATALGCQMHDERDNLVPGGSVEKHRVPQYKESIGDADAPDRQLGGLSQRRWLAFRLRRAEGMEANVKRMRGFAITTAVLTAISVALYQSDSGLVLLVFPTGFAALVFAFLTTLTAVYWVIGRFIIRDARRAPDEPPPRP
jgi:hypothetical protein